MNRDQSTNPFTSINLQNVFTSLRCHTAVLARNVDILRILQAARRVMDVALYEHPRNSSSLYEGLPLSGLPSFVSEIADNAMAASKGHRLNKTELCFRRSTSIFTVISEFQFGSSAWRSKRERSIYFSSCQIQVVMEWKSFFTITKCGKYCCK